MLDAGEPGRPAPFATLPRMEDRDRAAVRGRARLVLGLRAVVTPACLEVTRKGGYELYKQGLPRLHPDQPRQCPLCGLPGSNTRKHVLLACPDPTLRAARERTAQGLALACPAAGRPALAASLTELQLVSAYPQPEDWATREVTDLWLAVILGLPAVGEVPFLAGWNPGSEPKDGGREARWAVLRAGTPLVEAASSRLLEAAGSIVRAQRGGPAPSA